LKKNKSNAMLALRDILKKKDLAKYVSVHEGLKEIFIEIK